MLNATIMIFGYAALLLGGAGIVFLVAVGILMCRSRDPGDAWSAIVLATGAAVLWIAGWSVILWGL